LSNQIRPRQKVQLKIDRKDGRSEIIEVILRIDTPIEVDYYRQGGILSYVLRELVRTG
jgi:aconitate hydratase